MLEIRASIPRGDDFCLQVDTEISQPLTGIFGPSGAGKSTLLETIAGLSRPRTGRIVLDGQVLLDTERGIALPPHKRRVGVVFQEPRLLPHLRVRDNLEFGRSLLPRRLRRFDVAEVADWLDLTPLLSRRPSTLSGGESQRVALGRAVLMNPRLLLLDEPLTGQDVRRRGRILPRLRELHQRTGIPMLLVSHQLSDLLSLTDWLVLLRQGQLVGQGRYLDLVRSPRHAGLLAEGGLTNVLELQVARHCRGAGQTFLTWSSERVTEPQPESTSKRRWVRGPMDASLPIGLRVQASLRSRDIALAMAPVEFISMQNQFPGVIESIERISARTVCVVDIGVRLLVEVTPQTRTELGLAEGRRIWCLFKTRALELSPLSDPGVAEARASQASGVGDALEPWGDARTPCPSGRWSRS